MPSSPARMPAALFLVRIPAQERHAAVGDILQELQDRDPHDEIALSAARLLSDLSRDFPDIGADHGLRVFVRKAIEHSREDVQSLRGIVELCTSHDALREGALADVRDALAAAVDALSLQAIANTRISSTPTSPVRSLTEAEHASSGSFGVITSTLSRSMNYLTFLKALLWSPATVSYGVYESILTSLLTLVRSQAELSASSLEVLTALFNSMCRSKVLVVPDCHPGTENRADRVDHIQSFRSQMWYSIKRLLSAPMATSSRRTAFALWLRWIVLPEAYQPSQDILRKDAYWDMLQAGLRTGLSEQQKYCLHVLKGSLVLLEADIETRHIRFRVGQSKDAYTFQYDKYCTVFETVVLSRYPNQVEECFGDLQSLGKADAKIHLSWYVVLLETVLRSGTQDGIRNLIGSWILNFDVEIRETSPGVIRFLTEAFLPWTTQGFLFTATTRTVDGRVRCEHGNKLASFLVRCFRNSERNRTDPISLKDLRKMLVTEVLRYIHLQGGRVVPHAGAYILDGLVKAVESTNTQIDLDMVPLILKVASRTGLPEVARALYLKHCMRLCQLTGLSSDQLTELVPGFHVSFASFQELSRPTDDSTSNTSLTPFDTSQSSHPSFMAFLECLDKTRHLCLADTGLLSACRYLRRALDSVQPTALQPDDVLVAFEAVWDEAETQEYPKRVLMEVPGVLFHPTCISACPEGHALSKFLHSASSQLQQLSNGRIYVFPPLASSLRVAYLEAPNAAQVVPLDDFLIHFANNPPKPKIEFLLESATVEILQASLPHRTYELYYGKREGYACACIFDLLNRLLLSDPGTSGRIFERLIHPWATQKMPIPMVSKWKTTVQLQTMLILSESTAFTPSYVDSCMKVLAIEPLPRYRYLLEWIIVKARLRYPELRNELLDMLDPADESNPKFMASVMKMAVMVACSPDPPMEFSMRLMTLLIPLAASPKIIIRHEAHWSFPVLWDHVSGNGWTEMTSNPAFVALNKHIRSLDRYQNPHPGRLLEWLDPIRDHNLTHLFQGGYLQVDPPDAELVTREDFEAVLADDATKRRFSKPLPPAHIPLGDAPPRKAPSHDLQAEPSPNDAPATDPAPATTPSIPLQTKGTAWQSQLLLSDDPSSSRHSTDLIIIASLIDNAYNLGGLSRCAEIFGAASLHVKALSVLKSRDFTSVAVSSELHLPIHELPVSGIPEFLAERKGEGYTVVGVEQTDRSLVLGEAGTRLPRRCVLVMGSEREGIPGWLLAECDVCVEVRQVGITRSLNVQTAASVVLYEYGRQHGGRQGE